METKNNISLFKLLLYLLIHMETDTDIEIKMLKQREKEISKVVNRYMRIKLKRRIRKLFGLRLR
jgi:hypothetical protein